MQTKILKYLFNKSALLCLLVVLIAGCNKVVTTNTTTGTNNNNNNNNNPLNNDTLTDFPRIKFYTVMDYGNTKVKVVLNSSTPVTIAKYYPSSQYLIANKGSNYITVYYPDTSATSTVLSMQEDLISGCYYSCFIYRVGYEWKLSLVKDDVSAPSIASNAKIRVLDFRTQAYFNYVNVRIYNTAIDEKNYYNRNFLDHETYSSNALFKEITAGSLYHVRIYNDSTILKQRDSVTFTAGKIYSIVLMTPSTLSPSAALTQIWPDVNQLN